MTRGILQRGLGTLTVFVLLGWAADATWAQDAPVSKSDSLRAEQPPTTQPTDLDDTESLRALIQRRAEEARRRHEQEQAERDANPAPRRSRPTMQDAHKRDQSPAQPAELPSAPAKSESAGADRRAAPRSQAAPPKSDEQRLSDVPADFVGPPSFLSSGADAPAGAAPTPPQLRDRSQRQRGGAPRADVPPAGEAGEAGVDVPERRTQADGDEYWFNFEDMPWEDVIMVFVERLGKPLMTSEGDLIIGGTLTYVTEREFTKEEAIDELNLIMQEKGYRFVEQEHHIRVIPTAEMPQWVPVSETFPSVAAFEEANPRDMDYVTVYYQVEDVSADVYVDAFNDVMPIYARLSSLDDSNQIKMVALARDIRKFLALKDLIDISPRDPRELRIFDIKTNARDIERLLRDFLDLSSGRIQMVRDPKTKRMVPQRTAGSSSTQDVQMVADERTNSIIVKANRDRLEEIAQLIEQFDQKPDLGEFGTHVIEVQHADATEVANLLNQIFQQEQGQSRTPAWQRIQQIRQRTQRGRNTRRQPARRTQVKTDTTTPQDILAEGIFERAKKTIRLVADSRMNALIVYANEEGMQRVRELLEVLDKPQVDNFRTIELQEADVADVAPMLSQIVGEMGKTTVRGRGNAPEIVPDESRNVLYVFAERDEMQRIEMLVAQLDVPGPEEERHIIELENLRPSQVAQMVQTLLADGSGSSGASRSAARRNIRGRLRGGRTSGGAVARSGQDYQVIPLDEAQILIVICADDDWQKIDETVKLWDSRATTNTPRLATFTIEKADADTIAATLSNLYRSYQHPVFGRVPVYIQSEGNRLLVYSIQPAIDEISALIEGLDVEGMQDQVEILPLVHADASTVAQQVQSMVGGQLMSRGRGRGGVLSGPMIQAEAVTNSLIVQADAKDMERVRELAMRLDQAVGAQAPAREFLTPRYADPRQVAQAISQVFGSSGGGRRGRVPTGSAVSALAVGAQVIVEAPEDKLPEIRTFFNQLDDPKGQEIVIKTVKIQGADVVQIARKLSTAFRQKRNSTAVFDADPTSETILLTCSKDVQEQAEQLIAEYAEATRELVSTVEFYQMSYAQAQDASRWLQEQLLASAEKTLGRNAARQIRVSADTRTNRVIINGPQLAVEQGKSMLEQYDVEVTQVVISPLQTEARKLPGLDVRSLANSLNQTFGREPARPDRLRATFNYDAITEMLIINAPKDMYDRINSLIETFAAETADLTPEQEFIAVKEADANYVANQVRSILQQRITGRRGRDAAQKVSITVDTRLNRVIVNAPQFAIDMAKALIAELDQPPIVESQLQTIALENADAGTVNNVLRQIFSEKIRARTLQISAEPMTNSLIVGGTKEDFEDIEKWARELDEQAISKRGKLEIVELLNANPWEVSNILNAQYGGGGRGRRQKLGQEYRFDIVAGRSIVAQAPESKMPEILELIDRLDKVGVDKVEVRTYELSGIGDGIHELARQVTNAVNSQQEARERRITITPYPAADTLIVTARTDQFAEIEEMMDRFKSMVEKETTVMKMVSLQHLDAGQYAGHIQSMLANKINRAGRGSRALQTLQIIPDQRTNRLICYLPEKILPDLDQIIEQLDVEATDYEGKLRTIELSYADANTVANILRPMFEQQRNARRGQDISQIVVRIQPEPITNSLIVTASDQDFEEIRERAMWIDENSILKKAEPELIDLAFADPNQVAQVVQNTFRTEGGWGRTRDPQRDVSATVVGASILVQAPKDRIEEVRALIAKLDVLGTDEKPVTIALDYADANQMVQMINTMFGSSGRRRGQQQNVQATVSNGLVVVKAPKQTMQEIQELVEAVDTPDPGGIQVRTFDLKVLNATQVMAAVQVFLRDVKRSSRPGQLSPGAFAEPTTNTLVVIAPGEQMPFIETLILDLEKKTPKASQAEAYVLKHVRAEQIAGNIDAMLRAKVMEREGAKRGTIQTLVTADAASNRLLVYAPDDYQELAARLIEMIDTEAESTDIVHIITLEYGEATQIAQSLNQIIQGNRRGSGSVGAQSGTATVRVSADAGSNSVILAGMPKDLAEVESWLEELEVNSTTVPELQVFQLKHATVYEAQRTLDQLFPRGRNQQDTVTITADEMTSRLIITANKRKMRQVEAFVEQLDAEPELEAGGGLLAGGRQIYFVDINRGSASDIAWDVRDILPDEEQGGPIIEADWFGEYIRVVCRPAEFPQVEQLIREFERRIKVEVVGRIYTPRTTDTEALIEYLRARGEEIQYEPLTEKPKRETLVETLWEEGEEPPQLQQRRERDQLQSRRGSNYETGVSLRELLLGDITGDESADNSADDPPAVKKDTMPPSAGGKPPVPRRSEATAKPLSGEQPASSDLLPFEAAGRSVPSPVEKEPVRIVQQPNGSLLIRGPQDDVNDITSVLDVITEDLATGEVVRIFKFKYGDVSAAAEVLSIMFDVQRQITAIQPQRRDQRRNDRNGGGDDDRGRGGLMDQLQNMVGGRMGGNSRTGSSTPLRIATDPAHNYLIVKCDETDLPEIRQLLRELDIPPGEVNIRIFQLKNLVADEAAQNIQDVLGISKAQQRRGRTTQRSSRGSRGNRQQQQLMEMLQQQMVSVPGVEGGAKVEQVEIVSNAVTNSLLVSAPPEVMTLVENVINQLEELEGRDVVGIYHHELENTRADDILPLLQEIFSSTSGGGGGGRGGRGGGSSPAALGTVTISADPRTNTIIYTAEAKDVEVVERQINSLDIAGLGPVAEAEMYVCEYGDAESIASVVEAIYGSSSGGGRGGRGNAVTGTTSQVRIIAEPATNSIVIWGPPDKRDLIITRITELDQLSEQPIRELDIVYADPEELAATLLQMFGGSGASVQARGGRGNRRGGGANVMSAGRITVIGDKAAKKLLIKAPENVYQQIEALVATLDTPSEQLQLRRFQLRYADASTVVDSVKNAMSEYMQLARGMGEETDFDAFTAVPDARTNSVMIVGSEETFLFVQKLINEIDIATPADQQKEFRVFVLEKVPAATVADAINGFASGGAAASGSGRRGRGASGDSRELNVYAVAEETTNSVMVFGRIEDIALVEAAVIAPLTDTISDRFQVAEIPVENVKPSQIVSFILQFMDVGGTGDKQRGRGGRNSAAGLEQSGPQIVPNDTRHTLVVRGTPRQIDEVTDLVQRFDDPDFMSNQIRVVQVPLGQDAATLAETVERIVNESEDERATQQGGQARHLTVGSDDYTNTIILAGDPAVFGLAEMVVDQLRAVRTQQPVTRVIQLKNLSADDAQEIINEIQQGRGSRSSGSRRGSSGQRGGSSGRRRSELSPQYSPGMLPVHTPAVGFVQPFIGISVLNPLVAVCVGGPADDPQQIQPQRGSDRFGDLRREVLEALADASSKDELTPARSEPPRSDARRTVRPASTQPPEHPAGPSTRSRADGDTAEPPVGVKPPAAGQQRIGSQPPAKGQSRVAGQPPFGPQTPVGNRERGAGQGPSVAGQPPAGSRFGEMLNGVSGNLQSDVTAAAVDSRRIVITGDADDVAFIEQILIMMEASTSPATIEVFALKFAKASALAPVIETAIQAKIAARTSQPGPQDEFSINAEGRSNSLIVSASEALMDEIALLVERLDVDTGETDFRTVPLVNMRASEAVGVLKPRIEELNKLREVPQDSQASISAVERTNSVMIIGTPQDIEEIARLVQAIDVPLTDEQETADFVRADVVVIQLKNGSAEDIATVLTDMIEEQQENARKADGEKAGDPFVKVLRLRLADGRELPELNLDRPIKIIPEQGTNSLIIFSSQENNEALQAIVGVFDTLPVGADTDVKAFVLKYAAAEDVAKLIEDTFDDKSYLSRPVDGDGKGVEKGVLPPVPPGVAAKGLPYPIVVQHDARSNTVIVIGRSDAVLLAGGLISELDRPTIDLGLRAYVLDLKRMSATDLAEKLEEILDDRADALGGENEARDSAVIQPEERTNSLIVFATDEVYTMIEDLVIQLDEADRYSVVDVRYRPLRYADAVKLQALLEELFSEKQSAEQETNSELKDSLKLWADTRSNSLLLTGTRDYLDEAEGLISQLDAEFDSTVEVRALKVKLNSAVNIAALLEDMIDTALKQQDSNLSGTPIYVSADPVSDSLLIAAAREDLTMIERWVQILDRPSEVGRMTLIVPLRNRVAEDIAQTVEDIFQSSGSQKAGELDVTVTSEQSTNSLVAFGPPAVLQDIEGFVRAMDSNTPDNGVIVRIFKLEQAYAEDAGDLLGQILDLESGTVGGSSSGGRSGSQDTIDSKVMLMFQREHPGVGTEMLRAMRNEISVIANVRTNSLVVIAPLESMLLMESLVEAVDVPPDAARIRVFRLVNSDAEQMVERLTELFEQSNTTTGGSSRGNSDESNRVLTVDGLGQGGRQEIGFTVDVRTNSVIAAGTPGYLDLVEEIILELDTIPIQERVTWVYSPKNMTAEALAPSIVDFSEAEQQRLQDIGDEVSTAVMQERLVTAIANEDSNRIIIDAHPRFRDTVMRVIEDLDRPPPQVMIQVLIIEVTMDNELDLGIEFAFQDLQYSKAGATDTTTYDYVGGTDLGAAGSGLGGFTFTVTGADFNFLFRTLQNEGNLKVLSRPQIVAMDNKEARIDISDDVPYVTGTQTSSTGQISTSVSREKVGITLEVTPQINPDGFVRMEILQKVSDLTGSTVDVGQGVTSPIFFTREAETTITVKDNETVVLGGLITSRKENREQKIPILGDVPGLGLLFRNQNDTSRRTELLVVLTPHVLRSVEDYRDLSTRERDYTGLIPPETLADPLLQSLRRPLDEPLPDQPPLRGEPQNLPAEDDDEDLYSPVRPALKPEERDQIDPDSYDVPLSWGRRSSGS